MQFSDVFEFSQVCDVYQPFLLTLQCQFYKIMRFSGDVPIIGNQVVADVPDYILVGTDNGKSARYMLHTLWVITAVKPRRQLRRALRWVIRQQEQQFYFWVLMLSTDHSIRGHCIERAIVSNEKACNAVIRNMSLHGFIQHLVDALWRVTMPNKETGGHYQSTLSPVRLS